MQQVCLQHNHNLLYCNWSIGFILVCVHGFRVQRFNVFFGETWWNKWVLAEFSIELFRHFAYESTCYATNLLSQPKIATKCQGWRINDWDLYLTSRMWLGKASVTFLIKLATSVARGGAEPVNGYLFWYLKIQSLRFRFGGYEKIFNYMLFGVSPHFMLPFVGLCCGNSSW